MSENYYRQCTYKSTSGLIETAWIPEKLAVVGKKIYFGNKTKTPETLWEVISASDGRHPESYLRNHERDYKTQREASDI